MTKRAFLFPGQGAQYPGMGKDFYDNFSAARQTFEEASDLLGRSLAHLVFEAPEEELTATHNSQVAIYVVCSAILRVLNELYPELKPEVTAGLSLGEYVALQASSRVSFGEGLKLVERRGRLMSEACERTQGTMAVVLGLNAEDVEALVKQANLPEDLWVANLNCPGQVVLSGTLRGIEVGCDLAKKRGAKRVLSLPVHGAFHSGLMKTAEDGLRDAVMGASLTQGSSAFVMNVPGDFVSDMQTIRKNLISQVTHSVRWEPSVRAMEAAGVDLFIEIGCGKTLSGFNKRIGVKAPTVSIEKVAELESLKEFI